MPIFLRRQRKFKNMVLNNSERQRYHRQMLIEGWGEEGQKKLKNSFVFIAGAGGLGSPVAIYLAVAGVGRLKICDFDTVELSNLNRQILHTTDRIGLNKGFSAKKAIHTLNPFVKIEVIDKRIDEVNVRRLTDGADIIMDCMDNFPTRYLLNKVANENKIPLVHGSIWGMEGRLTFIHPPHTPCLKCIFPEPPPQATFPVLGATPGTIGCLQAMEALKFLTGVGENLKSRLLIWDGMRMDFWTVKIKKDPDCPVCKK